MAILQGVTDMAKTMSDYVNNGMGQKGAYAAVRNARLREAGRNNLAPKVAAPVTPIAPAPAPEAPREPTVVGDNTLPAKGGAFSA